MTFDFSDWSYATSSLNHTGFGLGDDGEPIGAAGLDLIVDVSGGVKNLEIWAGVPSIDLGLFDSPEAPLYEETIGDFDLPTINERVTLLELKAGQELVSLSGKDGLYDVSIKLPAGAIIDTIAYGGLLQGESVSPVNFVEAEADLDKFFYPRPEGVGKSYSGGIYQNC